MRPDRKDVLEEVDFVWRVENQRGSATGSCNALEKDAGRDEESTKVQITGSDPDQDEVVKEVATPDDIPFGWTRTKLEPDW
jgi:hypothetical protein